MHTLLSLNLLLTMKYLISLPFYLFIYFFTNISVQYYIYRATGLLNFPSCIIAVLGCSYFLSFIMGEQGNISLTLMLPNML